MKKLAEGVLGSLALVTVACREVIDPPGPLVDLAADAAVVADGPARELFFTDAGTGKIWRATMSQSGKLTSAMPILQRSSPVGLAIDAAGGKLYWTDNVTNTIERARLTPPFTIDPPVLSGLGGPVGIALDHAAGKMYWIEEVAREIHRANLSDGSNNQMLLSGRGDPRYIVLDGAGHMYWSDATFDEISRANLDGSGLRVVISSLIGPYGLAIDRPNRALYWTDNSVGTIQRTTSAGTAPPFVTGIATVGIALDLAAGKIYWAANWDGKIQRSNLDGSNIEDLVTGLVNPHGVALRSGTTIVPPCSLRATGPDVWVRFTSNGGGFNNDTHWYDALFGVAQQFLFNNVTGVPGTEVKIAHTFAPGDEVFIGMLVNTTGLKFWTGPGSRNPDGIIHFRAIPVLNDPKYQVRGGFEETSGGGDRDFDDLVIDIGGVQCS